MFPLFLSRGKKESGEEFFKKKNVQEHQLYKPCFFCQLLSWPTSELDLNNIYPALWRYMSDLQIILHFHHPLLCLQQGLRSQKCWRVESKKAGNLPNFSNAEAGGVVTISATASVVFCVASIPFPSNSVCSRCYISDSTRAYNNTCMLLSLLPPLPLPLHYLILPYWS